MIKAIRNIIFLFALAIIGILGVGLYRQYTSPTEGVPEQAATTRSVASDTAPMTPSRGTLAEAPVGGPAADAAVGAVAVDVPLESEAEFFALSVKMINEGVVEIKSRREEAKDVRYFVHLVTCTTLRTGVVADSADLAGLAERNETPVMVVPQDGSAELMLSQIACASVEN